MADTHSIIYSTIDKIQQIMKQKKMIHFGEDEFFPRLIITLENTNKSTGGVKNNKNKDGVSYPQITLCYSHINFVSNWEEYLGNTEYVKKMLKKKHHPAASRILAGLARRELLFTEYNDFHQDPEIGDFVIQNQEEYLACILCHEMAHCIQQWNCEPGWNEPDVHNGHNAVWKKYYRILRREMGLVTKRKRDYRILRRALGLVRK